MSKTVRRNLRARKSPRPELCCLTLETLEMRLPPGDSLISTLLGTWLMGACTGGIGAGQDRGTEARGGRAALSLAAPALPARERAITLVQWGTTKVHETPGHADRLPDPGRPLAPVATSNLELPPAGGLRRGSPAAMPGGFGRVVTAGADDMPHSAPDSGRLAVMSSGSMAAGMPAVPGAGSEWLVNAPRTLSAANLGGGSGTGQNLVTALPDGASTAAPVSPSATPAACASQSPPADPWGGDPRTTPQLHADTSDRPAGCAATPATGTGPRVPPPGGLPVNVLVNDPAEDGTTNRDTQSETTLAVDGTTVMAAYNDSFKANLSPQQYTGYSFSTDQGETFTDGGGLPVNPAGDLGDPVLAHDNQTGRTYLATLSFGVPLHIWRSDDDLHTIMAPVNGAPGRNGLDKEWLTVDNFAGAGQGNVYLVIRDFGGGNGIYLFRSTDQGATFGPNGGVLIASGSGGNVQGAWVTVGPDHTVYSFWYDATSSTASIKMRKSIDQGQTFGPAVTVTTLGNLGTNGDLGLGGFRSNAFPQAVVNPVNGNLYVVYDDRGTTSGDRSDVFFRQSTDGGQTWSARIRVNDDTTTRDQWQPALAVNPSGSRVGVFWYDRRNDSANNLIDRYGAIGTVTGDQVVFDPNIRISDTSFSPEFGHDPFINSVYMGDYDQAVADSSYFYLTWGDNRSPSRGHTGNNQDVRFAKIPQVVAGPSVVSTNPRGDTFGNISSIRVTFNEEIDPTTFTTDQVAGFTGPDGSDIPVTGITPVDGSGDKQFDVTFPSQHTLGNYQMVLGPDIEDTDGNAMDQNGNGIPGEPGIAPKGDQYAAQFTIQGPKVVSSTPSGIVPINQLPVHSLRVTFNEPMDPTTFTTAKVFSFTRTVGTTTTDLRSTISNVAPVAGTNNTQFDINFSGTGQGSIGAYSLVLGPDIRDTAGHQMDQNGNFIEGEIPGDRYTASFTIPGPRITASSPTGTLTGSVSSLRVTFNESMDPTTFTPSKIFSFLGPDGSIPITGVTPVNGSNNTQFTITFPLQGHTGVYHMLIGPDVRNTFGDQMDQNGNGTPGEIPGDRYDASFSLTGPRVTFSSWQASFVNGGPVYGLQVSFDRIMDPASFTLDKVVSFTRTVGTTTTDLSDSLLAVFPGSSFSQYTILFSLQTIPGHYNMVLGPDIRDAFGNQMDQNNNLIPGEIPGDRYTASQYNLNGPRVTTSTPSGTVLPGVTSVRVTFDRPMDPTTFTTDQVVSFTRTVGTTTTDLLDTVTGVVPVYGSNNTQFDITFATQGITGRYSLVIGPDIEDLFGNAMDQNGNFIPGEIPGDRYTASFNVSGPRVTASTPSGTVLPAVDHVRLTFDRAMNPVTFTTDQVVSFTLTVGTTTTDLLGSVLGVVPVAGSNNTQFDINFVTQAVTGRYSLVIGPDIQDLFANAMDQNGNFIPGEIPGDRYTATFNISGPRVTASTPTGNVLPAVDHVRVTFDRPMDPTTFTTDQVVSFTLTVGTTTTDLLDTVTGVVAVAGSNNTQFDINFTAQGATGRYSLVIGPDIQDLYGNAMDQNGNLIPGEVPGDRYTANFGLLGPRITASTPSSSFDVFPVDHVRVTFNEPMDPDSFTPDKIASFMGPDGPIDVTAVAAVDGSNNTQFDISFDPQDTIGTYTMVIGPDVEDVYGNPMDQNNNLIPGEIPGDQYTHKFTIMATPDPLGPDGFGYTASVTPFTSLDLEGQPGVITVVQFGNDAVAPVDLGTNTFNFYGQSYTGNNQLFVNSSGYITFGSGSTLFANTDLTSSPTQPTMAALWGTWSKFSGTPMVLAKFVDLDGDGVPDQLVVQWNRVQGAGTTLTFQAILSLNTGTDASDFTFNYVDLGTLGGTSLRTIGIKDTGTQGANRLLVTYNTATPFQGTGQAILFHKEPDSLGGKRADARLAAPGTAGMSAALALALQYPTGLTPLTGLASFTPARAALPVATTASPGSTAEVDQVFTDVPGEETWAVALASDHEAWDWA